MHRRSRSSQSTRALEPFFTTKHAGAGSGLGLSMVYGVVKQLDGEVAIVSEPGRGASVNIYLPRAAAAAPSAAVASPAPALAAELSGTKVLLVDDDWEVLAFMAAALREAGCEITEAASGSEAIDLFGRQLGFDLVFIDYAMPGMNGTAAARAMQSLRPDVSILLVTGFAETLKSGDWPEENILHKPFGPATLRQRAQETTNRRRETFKEDRDRVG